MSDADPRPVPAARLRWLHEEVRGWERDGLVDDLAAAAILSRYAQDSRSRLGRLTLALGGAFLGVGVLWLVAANLETLPPGLRFAGVTAAWLGAVAAGEVLRRSGRHTGSQVAAAVAVLLYGGVVFQAAQSLQVPSYEPSLLLVWGLGALAYAYVADRVAALRLGVAVLAGWFAWAAGDEAGSGPAVVVALLVGAVAATAVALAHGRWRPSYAPSWRQAGAVLTLAGLFGAALAPHWYDDTHVPPPVLAGAVVAVAALAAAAVAGSRLDRFEATVVVLVLGLGSGMAVGLTDAGAPDPGGALLRLALLATALYVAVAGWYAVLGTLRDTGVLTALASGALVLFVVVQSFAVFQPLLSGAALFLLLGLLLLGAGVLVHRGRRQLLSGVAGVAS